MGEQVPREGTGGVTKLFEQLGKLPWMLTIVTGVLFFYGQQRLKGYYEMFDIQLALLDLPVYMYLVASIGVMGVELLSCMPIFVLGGLTDQWFPGWLRALFAKWWGRLIIFSVTGLWLIGL